MKIKRVLTIESIDEPSSRMMLNSIYRAKEFKGFEISHYFFLKDDQPTLDEESLYIDLERTVNVIKPEVILIHTGGYFYKYLSVFSKVISRLKDAYPAILFGIQDRSAINDEIRSGFDKSKEISELEQKFFRLKR